MNDANISETECEQNGVKRRFATPLPLALEVIAGVQLHLAPQRLALTKPALGPNISYQPPCELMGVTNRLAVAVK